jgi:menaquinone-dependent protoporphyrinogen oxidase
MNILIAYATVEGQTRKIASVAAEFFENRGWQVALQNTAGMMEFILNRPDAALLLAPVHAGRYPTPFTHFVRQEAEWLNSIPSAFVSVSLSIASDVAEERQEGEDYPTGLLAETGWQPLAIHNAGGALRLAEYDFFKRWMVRRLARNAPDASTAGGKGDREFTDWAALELFCSEFANEIGRRRA